MRFSILFTLLLTYSFSQAQQFAGTWEGAYITADTSFWNTIKLDIKYSGSNIYTIKSYTKDKAASGNDTFIVCMMSYKIIKSDSIILYETGVLDSAGVNSETCLQTMKLKLLMKHRVCELTGQWYCDDENDKRRGYIRLVGKACIVFND
jgi:hypothetical protein